MRSLDRKGYVCARADLGYYRAHRLIWRYMTGEWPPDEIDHINRVRSDNRWCNLRLATRSQNRKNISVHKDASSESKGVSWHKQKGKWRARIHYNGKELSLGLFDRKEDALAVYRLIVPTAFGEFGRYA